MMSELSVQSIVPSCVSGSSMLPGVSADSARNYCNDGACLPAFYLSDAMKPCTTPSPSDGAELTGMSQITGTRMPHSITGLTHTARGTSPTTTGISSIGTAGMSPVTTEISPATTGMSQIQTGMSPITTGMSPTTAGTSQITAGMCPSTTEMTHATTGKAHTTTASTKSSKGDMSDRGMVVQQNQSSLKLKEKVAALRKENSRLKARQTCRHCRTRPVNLTLLPCGHFCLCTECGQTFDKCPVCRKTVLADVRTFVS